jgi:hypothetical protein
VNQNVADKENWSTSEVEEISSEEVLAEEGASGSEETDDAPTRASVTTRGRGRGPGRGKKGKKASESDDLSQVADVSVGDADSSQPKMLTMDMLRPINFNADGCMWDLFPCASCAIISGLFPLLLLLEFAINCMRYG